MEQIHILNGDALVSKLEQSGLGGRLVVMRECLIEGPIRDRGLDAFWNVRAEYISHTYGGTPQEYFEKVTDEVQQLTTIAEDAEVYLWFENDLFCQSNLWFVLYYLYQMERTHNIYRIFPLHEETWAGFGRHTPQDLVACFEQRVALTEDDVALGVALWKAYASRNFERLKALSKTPSPAFHRLEEVVEAHVQRYPPKGLGRPQRLLQELKERGVADFTELFRQFFQREGIYGFGDEQIKHLLQEME